MRRFCPILALAALSISLFPLIIEAAEPATRPSENAYEAAIGAVYPALVQIYVLTPQYADGRERKFQAAGSGAIISPDGHVVTNHHVAGKAVAIRCILSTREELEAKLIGTDPLADIAIIKLDLASRPAGSPPLTVAHFGSSDKLQVGDSVLAMGCPLALSQSVTKGIIANKDMMMPRFSGENFTLDGEDVGSLVKWLGHDAQIFPGNSGGPLVNLQGEIIGVNEIGMGLSGAIPAEIASAVSQELIQNGKVRRAWIGCAFQPLLKPGAANPDAKGVLVSGVVDDSPAAHAGIKPGDIITAVDGKAVQVRFHEQLPALMKMILSKPVGSAIEFKILRGGQEVTQTVPTELRDEAMGKEIEVKEWGLTVRRVTMVTAKELRRPDQTGVLVGSVRPGGPSDKATPALAPNDVIVEVDGKKVPDVETFVKVTAEITAGKKELVAATVAFERDALHLLAVAEIGIRPPPEPPEEVKKPWLPVTTQVLSRKLAIALNLKGKKGVRITQVYPDSSAVEAGFKIGDIITHMDGQLVEASEPQDSQVFETMLRGYKVGSKAEFTVIRDGQPMTISTVLNAAPKAERELQTYQSVAFEFNARDISYLDRVKHRWSKDEAGALVSEVESGGWGAVGGLRGEDLIQSVNGKPVAGVKDLEKLLEAVQAAKPSSLYFFVKRGIHTVFIEIEPTWEK